MAYHVKRNDRELTDPVILENIIKRNRIAVIGMCRDNEPYVVTMSYGYDRNAIYFHCAKQGQKIDFLKENPNVCMTVIDDSGKKEDGCEHSYRSVLIKGKISFLDNEDDKIRAVKILIKHFEKDPERMIEKVDSDSGLWQRTQMLKLNVDTITGKEKIIPDDRIINLI